ncbi:MAG: hypothetical protein HY332_12865 [Chloroflexi bacterium]|nr:hypothetical protein [Chloroflexota bacterium]
MSFVTWALWVVGGLLSWLLAIAVSGRGLGIWWGLMVYPWIAGSLAAFGFAW